MLKNILYYNTDFNSTVNISYFNNTININYDTKQYTNVLYENVLIKKIFENLIKENSGDIKIETENLLKDYIYENYDKKQLLSLGSFIYSIIREKSYYFLTKIINKYFKYNSTLFLANDIDSINNISNIELIKIDAEKYYDEIEIDIFSVDDIIDDILER